MRQNTQLNFTKRGDRKLLTPSEVRYWRDILMRILKIGTEFELNLKESKGTCKGDTFICPCSHPEKEERKCYAECLIQDTCKLKKKYDCPGIYCVEFVSPCPTCQEGVRDCSRCELFDDPDKRPKTVREYLKKSLKPTDDLARVGEHGVLQITTDGSLLGDKGVEIVTVGRRVSYQSLYEQSKSILDIVMDKGAYVNERTSIHTHLVAGYFALESNNKGEIKVKYRKGGTNSRNFIDELEKPIPEIVLANFHQLIRRFHNALVWISSSGDSEEKLTRWMKYRMPILKYSPVKTNMSGIAGQLAQVDGHSGKYSFINYTNIKYAKNFDEISRLHIEGRFCDGMLSPSAATSIGILLYAFMLKAISLSQYGIMQAGDNEYMKQAYEIQKVLLNNSGSWQGPRFSDTSKFEPFREIVRKQASDMVNLLHSELRFQGPAVGVLKQLADMPCSMRLVRGDSWEKIENDLCFTDKTSQTDEKILSAIDMLLVDDCVDMEEWSTVVANELNISEQIIKNKINTMQSQQKIVWDRTIGTFFRC